MLRNLLSKLYDGDAGRAGGGSNPGASARGRYAAIHNFCEKVRVKVKITVFAAGSRGDIQPCVVLSRGLQQVGYDVCLAAPKDGESSWRQAAPILSSRFVPSGQCLVRLLRK